MMTMKWIKTLLNYWTNDYSIGEKFWLLVAITLGIYGLLWITQQNKSVHWIGDGSGMPSFTLSIETSPGRTNIAKINIGLRSDGVIIWKGEVEP